MNTGVVSEVNSSDMWSKMLKIQMLESLHSNDADENQEQQQNG